MANCLLKCLISLPSNVRISCFVNSEKNKYTSEGMLSSSTGANYVHSRSKRARCCSCSGEFDTRVWVVYGEKGMTFEYLGHRGTFAFLSFRHAGDVPDVRDFLDVRALFYNPILVLPDVVVFSPMGVLRRSRWSELISIMCWTSSQMRNASEADNISGDDTADDGGPGGGGTPPGRDMASQISEKRAPRCLSRPAGYLGGDGVDPGLWLRP